MMKDEEIRQIVRELGFSLVEDYLDQDYTEEEKEEHMLQLIVSNSTQAVVFISLIEEEFDIEVDDDDINLTFFSDLDYVVTCVQRGLANRT